MLEQTADELNVRASNSLTDLRNTLDFASGNVKKERLANMDDFPPILTLKKSSSPIFQKTNNADSERDPIGIPINSQSGDFSDLGESKNAANKLMEMLRKKQINVDYNHPQQLTRKSKSFESLFVGGQPRDAIQIAQDASQFYQTKIYRLNNQLNATRTENAAKQNDLADMQLALRSAELKMHLNEGKMTMEAVQRDPDLRNFLMDRQNEEMIKERNELIKVNKQLRDKLDKIKENHLETLAKLEDQIVVTEKLRNNESEAMIRSKRLEEEFANQSKRFNQIQIEHSQRLTEERNQAGRDLRQELERLQNQLDKANSELASRTLDNSSLREELKSLQFDMEQLLTELKSERIMNGRALNDLETSLTKTKLNRDEALNELRRLTQQNEADKFNQNQCEINYKSEITELKKRLNRSDALVTALSNEKVQLLNDTASLKQDLNDLRNIAEREQQIHMNRYEKMRDSQKKREKHLNNELQSKTLHSENLLSEGHSMLTQQQDLIERLKAEGAEMLFNLNRIQKEHREEIKIAKETIKRTDQKLKRAEKRNHDLTEQTVDHAKIHEKMRRELADAHSANQKSQTEIIELIAKQTQLMQDRQILVREVQQIRNQIETTPSNQDFYNHHCYLGSGSEIVQSLLEKVVREENENNAT